MNPPDADSRSLHDILSRFSFLANHWHSVPIRHAGGFSGANIWRIAAGQGTYSLKRWPPTHPDRQRLEFIHGVLQHVARQGLTVVAVPLADRTGQSILEHDGIYYELSQWLPGEADFERRPTSEKLVAAMTVLAKFHALTANFNPIRSAPSSGISERRKQMAQYCRGDFQPIPLARHRLDWPSLTQAAQEFLSLVPHVAKRLMHQLDQASTWSVPQQPCIRDIWHDHVLFTGDHVTGVIDFGAMRMENVAGDVARLVGSLVADHVGQRSQALAAYENLRPLSVVERELFTIFDQSAIVLGGLNWLRWIFVEDRAFDDRARAEQRFAFLLHRLRYLSGR